MRMGWSEASLGTGDRQSSPRLVEEWGGEEEERRRKQQAGMKVREPSLIKNLKKK